MYLTICSGEVRRIQDVIRGLEIYLAELFSLQQIFVYLVFHQLMHSYILLKYYRRQLL